MKTMYIGSGDVSALMSGIKTKSYAKLLQRFVSDEIPYWNSKASPIDALRTGAILEERYGLILESDFYSQIKATSKEMDVFKCSLDFAKINHSKIVDFEELKTCGFNDFIKLEPFRDDQAGGIAYIMKTYNKYYNQVQEQLYCTGLDSATMTFLVVYSYDDGVNYFRDIQQNEIIKFRIERNESVISKIKERGVIFQYIKDYFNQTIK